MEESEEVGASLNRFRYQSDWLELKDSDGRFVLSPARLYSSDEGRFLQRDPLVIKSTREKLGFYQNSILGFHKQSPYVFSYQSFENSPSVFSDTTGEFSWNTIGPIKKKTLPISGDIGITRAKINLAAFCQKCFMNGHPFWEFKKFEVDLYIHVLLWTNPSLYQRIRGNTPGNSKILTEALVWQREMDHVRDYQKWAGDPVSGRTTSTIAAGEGRAIVQEVESSLQTLFVGIPFSYTRGNLFPSGPICAQKALSKLEKKIIPSFNNARTKSFSNYDLVFSKNNIPPHKHIFDPQGTYLDLGLVKIPLF